MMRIRTYFFALFTLCAFACATAYAQSANGGNSCIQIEDDAARLACFDQAFPTDLGDQEPPNSATNVDENARDGAGPTPIPIEADIDASQKASEVAAPTRSSAMGGMEESTAGPPETNEFGKAQRNPPPVASTELSGTVQKVSQRARGQHVVHLKNGQIWQENFASRYFPVKPGDTVVIKKRRFGGYRLVTESGKGFRVERVQ